MSQLAADLPRLDRFRITAQLRFLRTEDGGRRTAIASDYRTPCWFGLRGDDDEPLLNDVFWYFREGGDAYVRDNDGVWVPPGGNCIADGLVLFPEYVRPLALPGQRFEVWEGRTVAEGVVIEVFDPGPDAD